jgi:glycine dehydrogenase subunit 1
MAFIPHTSADVEAMLAVIGVSRIEDLFEEIPRELLIEFLDGVPPALNELLWCSSRPSSAPWRRSMP